MSNLKNLYYKKYFDGIDFGYLLKKDAKADKDIISLISSRNCELTDYSLPLTVKNSTASHTFQLKVLYPGLVTGVGINHESNIEGEFKLGMHFDHTTGLPVIYGSSVKGVLREYLKEVADDEDGAIEKAIFDGGKSIYDRDIFFDAVIVKGTGKEGKILAADSITPHKEGVFKNPIPITFLKIASGCTIEFRFKLVDTLLNEGKKNERTINVEQKLKWFKEILTTYGIGAKTNVGYGQFTEVKK